MTRMEEINGRHVRVARLGSGPPCVLLHGYPDNLQIFCALAPLLAGRFDVIAPDWPGMGYSESWKGGASPVHMAERLITLLDAWGIRTASVVAFDMGGQAAIVAAARYPARVRRLVVSNSLVFWDARTSWEIRVLRHFGWNRILLSRFPRSIFRRAERTFLPKGVRLPADLRQDLWSAFKQPQVRSYIVKMCAAYQGFLPRLPDLLRDIACPTLSLWAEHDAHFPLEHAERLQAAVPMAQFHILPGATHWMAWRRAPEVAAAISAFLAGARRF